MTDKASVEMETQSDAAFDSINEIIENLQKYSKVFDTSLIYQDYLQKSERYRQAIPAGIMQEIQEDYRKRNIEADAELEEDKKNFVDDYEKYVADLWLVAGYFRDYLFASYRLGENICSRKGAKGAKGENSISC